MIKFLKAYVIVQPKDELNKDKTDVVFWAQLIVVFVIILLWLFLLFVLLESPEDKEW